MLRKILIVSLYFLSSCSNAKQNPIIENYQLGQKVNTPNNTKVVLVGGCFDVLHYGHIQFLEKAKAEGNYLIVALEPDESISRYKKRTPIHTQQQRAQNLAAIRYVDKVLLLPPLKGYKDYNQLVRDVHPNIIAITADDPQKENKLKQANLVGADLKVVVDRLKGFSSTKIIGRRAGCNS
tara:strand:+ start:46725 stop:47264 length:540 start_codon:yes stop_codon:yes gene_type:complete